VYLNLGVVYRQLGRNKEAADACRRALGLKPDYAEAYYQLASARFALRQYKEARDACLQAVRLKPDWAEAHRALGVIYVALREKEAALEQYTKLKSLDPELASSLFKEIYWDQVVVARK
jgi:tetratricopeptide (TPR) repeat protein